MYCIIVNHTPGHITSVTTMVLNLIVLVIEVFIGLQFYKNWVAFRSADKARGHLLHTCFRMMCFTFCGIVTLSVEFVFLSNVNSPIPNVFLALIPVEAVIVFGLQSDILRSWASLFRIPIPKIITPTRVESSMSDKVQLT